MNYNEVMYTNFFVTKVVTIAVISGLIELMHAPIPGLYLVTHTECITFHPT